jgi:hypothetical protein
MSIKLDQIEGLMLENGAGARAGPWALLDGTQKPLVVSS